MDLPYLISRHKLPVYIGVSLLILSIFALGYFLWDNKDYVFGQLGAGPKIAAKVAGETISLKSVKKLASDCGISSKEAAVLLVDEKVLGLWAADESVVISKNAQIEEQIRISGKPSTNRCVSLQATVNLLREKLFQNTKKFREGKFIVVNFGRYNPQLPGWPTGATSEAERKKLLKKERTYADNLVRSINNDLKGNKLTFEQAIEKVNGDPKVGINSWYATSAKSGPFTAVDYIEKLGLLRADEVRQKADALSPGEISEPFVQKVPTGVVEGKGSLVEARWIIAKVERVSKGYQGTATELLKKTREKYDAKIYLK